jgi:DNA (cytosine-5)-methyltransferase 1
MGFPDSFVIPVSDTQAYRQFGNSVVVPMLTDVAQSMVAQLQELENSPTRQSKERGRVSNKKIA